MVGGDRHEEDPALLRELVLEEWREAMDRGWKCDQEETREFVVEAKVTLKAGAHGKTWRFYLKAVGICSHCSMASQSPAPP